MNRSLQRLLKQPVVVFAAAWAALLAVLFAPLLAGGVIVNRLSDGKDGYVTRHFAALVLQKWHEIPRWDPYIFGGLPFLGAMHGDQAYPISILLRAIFPPALPNAIPAMTRHRSSRGVSVNRIKRRNAPRSSAE